MMLHKLSSGARERAGILAPFGFFFQLEQCFSLVIIQPEQCFLASFCFLCGAQCLFLNKRENKPQGDFKIIEMSFGSLH